MFNRYLNEARLIVMCAYLRGEISLSEMCAELDALIDAAEMVTRTGVRFTVTLRN
jgi:hypothetical protein